MVRVASALVFVLVLVLATASAAHGASIRLYEDRDHRGTPTGTTYIDYEAEPGEANRLRILTEPQTILFRDDEAEIAADPDCTAHGPHEVSCPRHLIYRVTLGDMDDSFSGEASSVTGGEGDDRLVVRGGGAMDGGTGADVIEGSSGNEYMTGGPGADVLLGHDGDDELTDGGPESDLLDGGNGADRVVYYGARGSYAEIDLNREAPNGAPGENDRLVSIEGVEARTAGSVRLTGTPSADHFSVTAYSKSSSSVVVAGAGDDFIDAVQASSDYIRAGPGDDEIRLSNHEWKRVPDDIGCGSGLDTVDDPNPASVIPRDCETVRDTYNEWRFRLSARPPRSRSQIVRASLYYSLCPKPCRPRTLTVRRADPYGSPVGRVLGRTAGPGDERLSLRLNRLGRRTLARRRSMNAVFDLTGDATPFRFVARLGARR